VNRLHILVILATLVALEARAAEPPCIARCHEMATAGTLRKGVNEKGCVTNLCQEDARSLYKNGEFAAALESLDVLSESLVRSPSYLYDRGRVYYALGRFDEALEAFDASLQALPDVFECEVQRGHTLIRLQRYDAAREQFSKLLDSKAAKREFRGLRTRSYLLGNIGAIDVMSGDTAKGKTSLLEALKVDGRNTQASTFLFRALPQLDKGAIDREGIAMYYAATEDAGLGDRKRAEQETAAVIAKYPKFAESYFLESDLLRSEHRYEECEKFLTAGEREIPDEIDLKADRLRCTLLKLDPTSAAAKPALAELKSLNKKHPDNALTKEILHALDLY
jgi:tetratricopeptide (TPR) repeat protein